MEVISFESKAFVTLMGKIDEIAAYVEEYRQRESDGQQEQEEKRYRKADK